MPENRYLDEFIDSISESDFVIESDIKKAILQKTIKKIRRNKWFNFKSIAAACILLVVLSALIPNTPVNALYKKIFSFIPGVGIVQNPDGENLIKAALNEPVKVFDGNEFVEVKSAYITGKLLRIFIMTNVGSTDVGRFNNLADYKKYMAEISPRLYMIDSNEKIKSNHSVWTRPSFETQVYSIEASFILGEEDLDSRTFKFEIEGFSQMVEIVMSSVNSGTDPESMGNVAIIDNVMVFANVSRTNGILEVLLSSVTPEEFKNVRFHLYDHETQLFEQGIYVVDEDGNIYKPDDELRQKNNDNINNLYFNIPDDKDGLRLIIPQILYEKRRLVDLKTSIPEIGKERIINKELDFSGTKIIVEKASIITATDSFLHDEFKADYYLRIDASGLVGENKREMVVRVIPTVKVSDGGFYLSVSQCTSGELWDSSQKGYSITAFDELSPTKKIILNFDIECAMTGPWEINLK